MTISKNWETLNLSPVKSSIDFDYNLKYQKSLEQLEKAFAKDVETHTKNITAIETNKEIREKIADFVDSLGLPKKYYSHKYKPANGRSRGVSQINWYDDLLENYPVDDGFEQVRAHYARCKKALEDYKKANEDNAKLLKAREQEEENRRKALIAIGAVYYRYGIPPDADKGEALEYLLNRCKYLRLAHAMHETRDDFRQTEYSVAKALEKFKIESEEDQKIYEDVSKALDTFYECGDGRVFRDIEYNYNYLYKLVDRVLLEDYLTLCELV